MLLLVGSPSGSAGKESACSAGDWVLIPGSGRSPGKRNGKPTPGLLPEEFQGQRSLAGYGPWDYKELDLTERQLSHLIKEQTTFLCVNECGLAKNPHVKCK